MRRKKGIVMLGIIFFIFVVAAGAAGFWLAKKYMPSREMADLQEYFGIEAEDDISIIVNQEIVETKGIQIDGNVYFPLDMVKEVFNDRFYYDYKEDILIYTMPEELRCAVPGDTGYTLYENLKNENKDYEKDYGVPVVLKQDDIVYVEAYNFLMDYMYDIGNVQVTGEPERIVIQTIDWIKNAQYATVTKKAALRKLGGVKSPILRNLEEGEVVAVKEIYDTWMEVVTQDGFVGFVQSKRINLEEGEAWECAEAKEEPEFSNLVRDKKINLAWHQSTSLEANAKLTEVLSGTSGINVISPTWFALSDNNGNFTSLGEKWYVDTLHNMGIEVWGLISNFEKSVDTSEVLSYTSKRQYLIRNLVEQSKALGLDGINLDFETISVDYKEDYIQFIRELSVACRLNKLVLSVDNYVPTGYTAHYNRKEQGIFADYVIIMGYDEHYSGSETAGSVASIGFVKEGIDMTLQEVPAEKVINAIPFYTRIWKEVQNSDGEVELSCEAAGMERVEKLLSEQNIEAGWNEECAQFYAEYELDGATYKIWMENEISIEEKMKLIQENNLAGVAEWKLGLQKNSVWNVINKYLQ